MLDDLAVDEFSDLGHGIVGRPEELVRLPSGGVVFEHFRKSRTDINSLAMINFMVVLQVWYAYMDWPKSLLEVIRCNHIRYSSKLFEQAILESEYGCWADDCCFGEDTPDDLLASSLQSISPQ